jgi:phage gp45-like
MIEAAIQRIIQRVQHVIGRGRVTTGNDAGNVQLLQVKLGADEIRDNTPRLAEFGFTSMPPAGSDAVVVFIGGDRSNGAIIATGHQASRLKGLKPGEAAIFDDQGQSVFLTRTGIVINCAGLPMTINGNVTVNGTVSATTDVIAAGTSLHTHHHGGVASGGSNTGGPV